MYSIVVRHISIVGSSQIIIFVHIGYHRQSWEGGVRERNENGGWISETSWLKTLQCMEMQLANDSTAVPLSLIKRIRWKDFVNPLLMENYYLNAALYSLDFFASPSYFSSVYSMLLFLFRLPCNAANVMEWNEPNLLVGRRANADKSKWMQFRLCC